MPGEKSIEMMNKLDYRITFSIPSKLICGNGRMKTFSRKRPIIIDDDNDDDDVAIQA